MPGSNKDRMPGEKFKLGDLIDERMEALDAHQGDLCNYLNGRAVRKFL